MLTKKQIPVTDYCPTQKTSFIVYGNYIFDGFEKYVLGTITCPYKENGNPCGYNPCPLRSKLKETM